MIISTSNIFLNTHNVSVAIFIINSTLKCTKENMLKNQTNNKHIFVYFFYIYKPLFNRIGGVIVSMLASIALDRGFEPWTGQTKDYRISISCFSVKHAALRRTSKDWLALNQNNVSDSGDMSISGLLFQWPSTIKTHIAEWMSWR